MKILAAVLAVLLAPAASAGPNHSALESIAGAWAPSDWRPLGLPAIRPRMRLQDLTPEEQLMVKVVREAMPSVVQIFNYDKDGDLQGTGSGVVWDSSHVVTNHHVAQEAARLTLRFDDGTQADAALKGSDLVKDVAVLSFSAAAPAVKLGDSDKLARGQLAIAIGSPFGYENSISKGVISGLRRKMENGIGGISLRGLIQTDAAVNPGNSGGGLFDSSGRLIGLPTMIRSESGSSSGVGFAIPVNMLKAVVPQLIARGKISRAVLGIGLAKPGSAVVGKVSPDSNAAKAGLKPGDRITAANGTAVADYDDLYHALDGLTAGTAVKVKVKRGAETLELSSVLVAAE